MAKVRRLVKKLAEVTVRIIEARKKKGLFPFVPLSEMRVVARIQVCRNPFQEEGREQPTWRGLVTFPNGIEYSLHLWEEPDWEGYDGELRQ